jgi:hypothetical protein
MITLTTGLQRHLPDQELGQVEEPVHRVQGPGEQDQPAPGLSPG